MCRQPPSLCVGLAPNVAICQLSMCLLCPFLCAAVAPGVKLIGLDVFDEKGSAKWSTLVAAIDWAVANRDKYNITAINLSLGGGSEQGKLPQGCSTRPGLPGRIPAAAC